MGQVTQKWVVDDRQVLKSMDDQHKANIKLREEVAKLKEGVKAAAREELDFRRMQREQIRKVEAEQQQLSASAKKVIDAVRTPFERYKAEAAQLREHLQSGRIDTDTYRRAITELAKATKKAAGETEEARAAQARENDELREAAQIVKRTETATERYEHALSRLNRLRKNGRIDSATYARAVKQERDALTSATPQAASFGRQMASVAAGVGVANLAMEAGRKAVEILREEYDRLIERQERSLGTNTSLARSQEKAADNLGDDPNINLKQLFQRLRKESLRTGTDEVALTNAVTDALSARGDQSAESAIAAVLAAGKLRRFSPEDLPTLSGASLDIGKSTGLSAEESLGFLSTIGQLSRVTSLQKLGQNVSPAIAGVQNFGASKEFSGALIAAISQASQDFQGATSGTGGIALAEQLREFGAGAPIEDTFRDILGSPEYRDAFLANASFEKKVLPAIEQLLTQGTSANNQFANALQVLQQTNFQERFDTRVAQLDALPAAQVARARQIGQNLPNQLALSDTNAAVSAAVRQSLHEVRDQLGGLGLSVKSQGLIEDFSTGGTQSLSDLVASLEEERSRLLAPSTIARDRPGDLVRAVRAREVTDLDRTQANAIDETNKLLRDLIALQQQANAGDRNRINAGVAAARKNNQGEGQ